MELLWAQLELLEVALSHTQIDSIQFFNFAQKSLISKLFYEISIQKIILFKINQYDSIQQILQF